MTVAGTSSTTENYYVASNANDTDNSANDELSNEDFMLLLLTQLQNQDPLEPMDNGEMVSQISEMESLEQVIAQTEAMTTISDQLSDLTSALSYMAYDNRLQSASALVGMYVTGLDDSGNALEGMVSSISMTSDGIYLNLHTGDTMNYDNIEDVTMAVINSDDSTDDTTDTTDTTDSTDETTTDETSTSEE